MWGLLFGAMGKAAEPMGARGPGEIFPQPASQPARQELLKRWGVQS